MLDIGSHYIKLGFSGHDTPRVQQPTLLGKPKHPGIMIGMDQKDHYTGADAFSKRHLLTFTEVVNPSTGSINCDELEKLLIDIMIYDLKWTFED